MERYRKRFKEKNSIKSLYDWIVFRHAFISQKAGKGKIITWIKNNPLLFNIDLLDDQTAFEIFRIEYLPDLFRNLLNMEVPKYLR